MKTIVLDTNILIDNVHGFALWVNDLLNKPQEYSLAIPTIVISEYLTAKEFENFDKKERANNYLLLFKVQDLNSEIAEILGGLLRKKTYPQDANLGDLIIASTAIALKAPLATNNKSDFSKIPKLRLFDPKKL